MTIADQPPTHDMREADTILRELVELHRDNRYVTPICEANKRESGEREYAAWSAAYTWADAQKAEFDIFGDYGRLRDFADELASLAAQAEPAPAPAPAGCGYPYCGGNAPECKTCGNKRAAPAPADEPPPLRQEDAK
jgi:hypothetical protein